MRFSLVPRDSTFFDLFSESGQNTLRAAKMLDEMMATWPDDMDIGREILIAEQEGDRITHDIIKRLNSTFVTRSTARTSTRWPPGSTTSSTTSKRPQTSSTSTR